MINIPSVNFHLWQPCNMRCKFCFATFQDVKNTILPKGHLPKDAAIEVVQALIDFGFEKITFVGGEPTLCPWLFDLIKLAKENGVTTMIVTNGTRINDEFLEKYKNVLDWITLSIDSLNEEINIRSGRAITGKKALSKEHYKDLCFRIKTNGYQLKINSVIHAYNYQEDFTSFISTIEPKRWKVFQVLPIKDENDTCIDKFKLTPNQFHIFKQKHQILNAVGIPTIFEDNDAMTSSYVMIDPAGRFFDNSKGLLHYSRPILTVGIESAYNEVLIDEKKFEKRGGIYDWEVKEKVA